MEVGKSRARSAGRLMGDVLDAWVSQSLGTWAPSSARDQQSRVKTIKADAIARIPLARLTVGDVERWHARMRHAGYGDALQWSDVHDGMITIDSAVEVVRRGDRS
jgi:hypothetical protein